MIEQNIPFVCTPSLYDPNVNIFPPTQLMADGGRFCKTEVISDVNQWQTYKKAQRNIPLIH